MTHDTHLDELAEAEQRLTRTVDALHAADWSMPSGLPGWTRAHVVAHVALNGEALTEVLRGAVAGQPVPMYESQEKRDADIDELAEGDPADLRARLLATLTTFREAVQSVPADTWDERFDRTPGGPVLSLRAVPGMRWREVEIHHADLDLGYSFADWPPAFAAYVVKSATRRPSPATGFRVTPLDVDHTWDIGDPGPDPVVVTGPVAHVAWWLTGRAPSSQVVSSRGALPEIGAW